MGYLKRLLFATDGAKSRLGQAISIVCSNVKAMINGSTNAVVKSNKCVNSCSPESTSCTEVLLTNCLEKFFIQTAIAGDPSFSLEAMHSKFSSSTLASFQTVAIWSKKAAASWRHLSCHLGKADESSMVLQILAVYPNVMGCCIDMAVVCLYIICCAVIRTFANGVYSLKWRLTDRYLRWGTLAGPTPISANRMTFCRNCASRVSRAFECPPLAFRAK